MSEAPSSKIAPVAKPAADGGRRKVIMVIGVVLLVVGLAVGVPWYLYTRSHKSTDDAFITGSIVSISPRVNGFVTRVYVEDNQWVNEGEMLVELDPADYEAAVARAKGVRDTAQARIESARAGVDLTTITANAGQDEAASAVRVAESALESAKTRVGSASTRVDQSVAAVAVAKASAEEARASAGAAQAQADLEDANLKRAQDTFKGGAITQQDLDRAVAAAHVAQANLQAALKKVATEEAKVQQAQAARHGSEDSLTESKSQNNESAAALEQARARLASAKSAPQRIEVSKADARTAEADLASAEAALRQAELALSYTHIKAPRRGRVTGKTVHQGEYYATGQEMLALVPDDVWVVANYKETDLTHMRPGQSAVITVDAYPGEKFHGRVDSIQAGTGASFALLPPENSSGNYIKVVQRVPVKIVFDPMPDLVRFHLAPGMSVIPTVDVSGESQTPRPNEPSVNVPVPEKPS